MSVSAFDPAEEAPEDANEVEAPVTGCAGGRIGLDVQLVQLIRLLFEIAARSRARRGTGSPACTSYVDLPLTERVVEGVVDCRRRDAQSRGGDPVDHERHG